MDELYLIRGKCILMISVAFIMITLGIEWNHIMDNSIYDYDTFFIEDINVKDMTAPNVKIKSANLVQLSNTKEIDMEIVSSSLANNLSLKRDWYFPVEIGNISNSISYSHTAVDITSNRGVYESIYPIANGVISSIYTDSAGAKIVTVQHFINSTYYTSMYVHLSSYAPNLYVGKEVTINDCLGKMGRTGIATGVHLHLELADCNLYKDDKCRTLADFFKYQKLRYNEGYRGIYSVLDLPNNWINR